MPPNFWMSSVASSWTTSTMSSTVTMPFTWRSSSRTGIARKLCSWKSRLSASWSISSCAVTTSVCMMSRTELGDDALHVALVVEDRDREEVVLLEETAQRFLVHLLVRGDDVGVHDVAHRLRRRRREELAKRHDPEQMLLGVEHVDVIDRLEALARLAAQIRDRLVDAHLRAQASVVRVHEAARLVFGIREQRRDLFPRRVVEQRKEALALLFGRRLNHVGGVVERQQPHREATLGRSHRE